MFERLKHAFAIDRPEDLEPTERQAEMVDRLCRYVHRRRMFTPVSMLLELSRPLNYVTAQVLHAISPMIHALFDRDEQDELARFLEQRGSIDYIVERLEAGLDDQTEEPPIDGTDNPASPVTPPDAKADPSAKASRP